MKFSHLLFIITLTGFFFSGNATVIKRGDVLNIVVKEEEALSRTVIVDESGRIDYPLYSDRNVANMTTSELMDQLTLRLAKNIENPFVLVTIEPEAKISVTVLGQVKNPGRMEAPQKGSIQEVLKLAGGVTEYADLEKIKLLREGQNDLDAQFINLEKFFTTGEISLLPSVKNNDTYIITKSRSTKKVMVRGAVRKPGAHSHYADATILDMIHMAGGPADNANFRKVRHISGSGDKRTDSIIDIQKYLDRDGGVSEDIPSAKEGDVIYVYEKTITWGSLMSFVRDITTVITLLFLIYRTAE
ncbi:MAG: polysaccharide biosynthesis/export family protein [Fibrobacterota bacterium]